MRLPLGTYYHYVNFDRRERFITGVLGDGIKFYAIGHTRTARAFGLLLTRPYGERGRGATDLGRWAGHAVAIVGDDPDPEWDDIVETFTDIEANVLRVVYEVDGFGPLAEAAEANDGVFMALCHLALTGQMPALREELARHFGVGFRKRYEALARARPGFIPHDLVSD